MTRQVMVGLWVLLVAGLGMTARLAIHPLADGTVPQPAVSAAESARVRPRRVATESAAVQAVAHNAFRIARQPASTAYDPQAPGPAEGPPPIRPPLKLVGIVWDGGLDPAALLEGLPGVDGPRTVRRGERLGELRVRTIAADHVVVLGPDTVWVLTVREPWRDTP